MKDLKITPKTEALFWFSLIGVLIFLHTYILNHDLRSWILINFFLSGLLVTLAFFKGLKIIIKNVRF